MPLPIPNLDDRTYDQLVTEARALIPKYFPTWTDHNSSDPGIALLELFAYLIEAAIYQINRVPERSLEHFAELVGITRGIDEPIDTMFRRALESISQKERAISTTDFEFLARCVVSCTPTLQYQHEAGESAVMMTVSSPVAELQQNATAGSKSMSIIIIADLVEKTVKRNQSQFIDIDLKQNDVLFIDDGANTEFVQVHSIGQKQKKIILTIKSPLRFSHPQGIKFKKILSPIPKAEKIIIAATKPEDPAVVIEPLNQPLTSGVLQVGNGSTTEYACIQGIARVKALVEVVDPKMAAITITVLGKAPLNSTVYAINVSSFNSGILGFPYGSLVTKLGTTEKSYLAKNIVSHQLGITQIFVKDREFFESININDQLQLTPKLNVYPNDQVIKIIIIPDDPDEPAPTPNDELRQAVFNFLRSRRLITTPVQVVPPKYDPVSISVTVVRNRSSRLSIDSIKKEIEGGIINFTSPLKGGKDGTGWEFGRSVYQSELYQIIEGINGVEHVKRLTLLQEGVSKDELKLSSTTSLVKLDIDQLLIIVVDE